MSSVSIKEHYKSHMLLCFPHPWETELSHLYCFLLALYMNKNYMMCRDKWQTANGKTHCFAAWSIITSAAKWDCKAPIIPSWHWCWTPLWTAGAYLFYKHHHRLSDVANLSQAPHNPGLESKLHHFWPLFYIVKDELLESTYTDLDAFLIWEKPAVHGMLQGILWVGMTHGVLGPNGCVCWLWLPLMWPEGCRSPADRCWFFWYDFWTLKFFSVLFQTLVQNCTMSLWLNHFRDWRQPSILS